MDESTVSMRSRKIVTCSMHGWPRFKPVCWYGSKGDSFANIQAGEALYSHVSSEIGEEWLLTKFLMCCDILGSTLGPAYTAPRKSPC